VTFIISLVVLYSIVVSRSLGLAFGLFWWRLCFSDVEGTIHNRFLH